MMTSQQLLCNASCFERIARRSKNASAGDLKQPLLVVVEDLESSPSSQEQEQTTDDAKQRVSTLILTEILWIGAFAGLLLQLVTFSAFLVLFFSWGKNPQPNESAPLASYWTVYMLVHLDVAFYAFVLVGFAMTLIRKGGSLYLRKKFDNDADAPNREAVWTPRFLFLNGISFLLGLATGKIIWTIVDIKLGTPVPRVTLLSALLMEVGLCCLIIKCFDWGQKSPCTALDDEPEEDQQDSFFITI